MLENKFWQQIEHDRRLEACDGIFDECGHNVTGLAVEKLVDQNWHRAIERMVTDELYTRTVSDQ